MRHECLSNPIPFQVPVVIGTGKHNMFDNLNNNNWNISSKAYADDILSFTLSMMISNPNIDPEIMRGVAQTIDLMDRRAVDRHGYSHNVDEQEYQWIGVEKQLDDIIAQRRQNS